jgi:transcriptional regulator with XRE-family HTH domain
MARTAKPQIILEKVLKIRKLSKRQFAKRLGAQEHSVYQYFKPGYNPTFKTMCRWAAAIGCKVRDLIKE